MKKISFGAIIKTMIFFALNPAFSAEEITALSKSRQPTKIYGTRNLSQQKTTISVAESALYQIREKFSPILEKFHGQIYCITSKDIEHFRQEWRCLLPDSLEDQRNFLTEKIGSALDQTMERFAEFYQSNTVLIKELYALPNQSTPLVQKTFLPFFNKIAPQIFHLTSKNYHQFHYYLGQGLACYKNILLEQLASQRQEKQAETLGKTRLQIMVAMGIGLLGGVYFSI
jgi:hypothetical protein